MASYDHRPKFDDYWQRLIDESVGIKWVIDRNGGNCCKSSVEDVLMLRHPNITRYEAHEAQNHIECYNLDNSSFLRRAWMLPRQEPTINDYPEMAQVKIKWFRGNPFEVTQ